MHCQKLNTYMETGRVVFLPFSAISPNPNQPRTVFSAASLEELAEIVGPSIAKNIQEKLKE